MNSTRCPTQRFLCGSTRDRPWESAREAISIHSHRDDESVRGVGCIHDLTSDQTRKGLGRPWTNGANLRALCETIFHTHRRSGANLIQRSVYSTYISAQVLPVASPLMVAQSYCRDVLARILDCAAHHRTTFFPSHLCVLLFISLKRGIILGIIVRTAGVLTASQPLGIRISWSSIRASNLAHSHCNACMHAGLGTGPFRPLPDRPRAPPESDRRPTRLTPQGSARALPSSLLHTFFVMHK